MEIFIKFIKIFIKEENVRERGPYYFCFNSINIKRLFISMYVELVMQRIKAARIRARKPA